MMWTLLLSGTRENIITFHPVAPEKNRNLHHNYLCPWGSIKIFCLHIAFQKLALEDRADNSIFGGGYTAEL